MRRLRIFEHISLEGVIQATDDGGDFPYHDWTVPYRTPASRDAVLAAHGEHTIERERFGAATGCRAQPPVPRGQAASRSWGRAGTPEHPRPA